MALNWLRETVETYLDITPNSWEKCLSDREHTDRNGEAIEDFLSHLVENGEAIYFYQTYDDEGKYPDGTGASKPAWDEAHDMDGFPNGNMSSRMSLHRSSHHSMNNLRYNDPYSRAELPKLTLHVSTKLPSLEELQGRIVSEVVYMIKQREGSLRPPNNDPDAIMDYMAESVEYGVMHITDLLSSLENVVRNVFTPLLEPQLAPRGASTLAYLAEDTARGGDGEASVISAFHATANQSAGMAAGTTILGGGALSVRSGMMGTVIGASASTVFGGGATTIRRRLGGTVVGNPAQEPGRKPPPAPSEEDRGVSRVLEGVRGEFRSALHRFSTILAHTSQHISGKFMLPLPTDQMLAPYHATLDMILEDPKSLRQNEGLKGYLIENLENWGNIILQLVDDRSEASKGRTPQQEVDYWRTRSTTLTTLSEQVSGPAIQGVLAYLELAGEVKTSDTFREIIAELGRQTIEAKDNVRFLSTLDRHFKTLSTGSFSTVADTIPSLLNGLRMVWVISRHYNTDETMLPLLQRIVNEICERVNSEISLKAVIRLARTDSEEAMSLVSKAKALLDSWNHHYSLTRERIDQSDSTPRWEFDRRYMLDKTAYISSVLENILHVIDTVTSLLKFLTAHELRSLSVDYEGLGNLVHLVRRLYNPFLNIPYTPWDHSKQGRWKAEVNAFDSRVRDIEEQTQMFISKAFSELRSAEGALALLFRLNSIPMRASVRDLLETNASNIIDKARTELAETVALFEAKKANPLLPKSHPPVAGTIAWANGLYLQKKRLVLKIINSKSPMLITMEGGEELRQEYIAFARSVDSYVKGLYSEWCTNAGRIASTCMRQSILLPALLEKALSPKQILAQGQTGADGRPTGLTLSWAAANAALRSDPSLSSIVSTVSLMPPPPYAVNFPPELSVLISEACLLDSMGYPVPEVVETVALSESTLLETRSQLSVALDKYHEILSGLTAIEANLLQSHLAVLANVLKPGFFPLNWYSLHLQAYLADVHAAIQEFSGVLSNLRRSSDMLDDIVNSIASTTLVRLDDFPVPCIIEFPDLMDRVEKNKVARLELLKAKHQSMTPIFMQVEGLIVGSETGAEPRLAEYYRYWERKVSNALVRMATTSCHILNFLLSRVKMPSKTRKKSETGLLRVWIRASFSNTDVSFNPEPKDVVFAPASIGEYFRVGATFLRWKDGTCLPVEIEPDPAADAAQAPLVRLDPAFTFYPTLASNPISGLLMLVAGEHVGAMRALQDTGKAWGRLALRHNLIGTRNVEKDKRDTMNLPVSYYESKIEGYRRLIEEIAKAPQRVDFRLFSLDTSALASFLKAQAQRLLDVQVANFRESAWGKIETILAQLNAFELSLRTTPPKKKKIPAPSAFDQPPDTLGELSDANADDADFSDEEEDEEFLGMDFFTAKQRVPLALRKFNAPKDLDTLKTLLAAIARILDTRADMDFLIHDCRHRYETLAYFNLAPAFDKAKEFYDYRVARTRWEAEEKLRSLGLSSSVPGASPRAVSVESSMRSEGKNGKEQEALVSLEELVQGPHVSKANKPPVLAPEPDKAWIVDVEEVLWAWDLPGRWQEIVNYALTVDSRLVAIKKQFSEVTLTNIQKFEAATEAALKAYKTAGPASTSLPSLVEGQAKLEEYQKQIVEYSKERDALIYALRLLSLPVPKFSTLNELSDLIAQIEPLFVLYKEFLSYTEVQGSTSWLHVDLNSLAQTLGTMLTSAQRLPHVKTSSAYNLLTRTITGFQNSLPLIHSLRSPALKDRHWSRVAQVTGVSLLTTGSLSLSALFAMNLDTFATEIDAIVGDANQEAKIEKDLKQIADAWSLHEFQITTHVKDKTERGILLYLSEEAKLDLDDHQLTLQAIFGSSYSAHFRDEISHWEQSLARITETMDVWLSVQNQWLYLEGIFVGNPDIQQQLPKATDMFAAVDVQYKEILTSVKENSNVLQACTREGRLEKLQEISEKLNQCQKGLSEYLNSKRNLFPRFFFLSNDELLTVLGDSNPQSIQPQLLKLFDNVKAFTFKGATVTALHSAEGETVELITPAPVTGPVESWLTGVENEMRETLRLRMKEGLFTYAKEQRELWMEKVSGMVAVAGYQVWWTWETEDVFRSIRAGDKYAMKQHAERLTAQLYDLVAKVRMDLDPLLRIKTNTLLIVDVHGRDIIDGFVRDSITDANEFAWESQLRFYWDKGPDTLMVRQCTGEFSYGYEYMGLNGRLVITPLTDRCYMTLTQALTFHLGGAPAGPAGTGKTETTKDLAKNLALPCFVINCGEGLDYSSMGGILSGLCQVGAWGCFDEFNRINIEVLSVVSTQIRAIQTALNANRTTCDLGTGTIKLSEKIGIFITMNPGYAGRTELPDNLKALFRPVTMTIPDLLQICEIMLFSEGFHSASTLALKMTTLYKLAREQLSKQHHYDFGLRALKSVLIMAGSLKRAYSELSEESVLARALRDNNLPKFVFEDNPLFRGLMADLFPGLDVPRVAYPSLKEGIVQYFDQQQMKHQDEECFAIQVDKVIQIYEVMLTRHTTMVVGPSGGGKTVCLEALQSALHSVFQLRIKPHYLNPKAMTLSELYGVLDSETRNWQNGVLSNLFRMCNEPLPPGSSKEERWIIFDGDVDALWVENMNSVMDDNKLLTLPNGERLRLLPHCKLLVEVADLQYASPATISRCGMVYVDPKNLGYNPYFEAWLTKNLDKDLGENGVRVFSDLYHKYVPAMITYIFHGERHVDREPVTETPLGLVAFSSPLNMVKQLCSALDILTDTTLRTNPPPPVPGMLSSQDPQEPLDVQNSEVLEGMFLYALVWSLGALISDEDRPRFSSLLMEMMEQHAAPTPSARNESQISVYDFFWDSRSRHWVKWASVVDTYTPPTPFVYSNIMVPTVESVLYSWWHTHYLRMNRHVLFVGPSGSGKTIAVQSRLSSLPTEKFSNLEINFSYRTSAADVQTMIESATDKRVGQTYGPPPGKSLVVFLDDLHMPSHDQYGTQQPVAFLLFLISRGFMYDKSKDTHLKTYKDLAFCGASLPPVGGRKETDPRFLSRFAMFALPQPAYSTLSRIFSSILTTFYSAFPNPIQSAVEPLVRSTLELYLHLEETLRPTPATFHYLFNLRDLSRIFEGLLLATPDAISSEKDLLLLWRAETRRILQDRLISHKDIAHMDKKVRSLLETNFSKHVDTVLQSASLFGTFSQARQRLADGGEDLKLYRDLGSMENVTSLLEDIVELYNTIGPGGGFSLSGGASASKKMDVILFPSAVEHLVRLLRILSTPRGNGLLVGVGSSGKRTLVRLASYISGFPVFELSLKRGYKEEDLKEDLRQLTAMVVAQPVIFLLTDGHIVQESFLEHINNLLTLGVAPTAFDAEAKDAVISAARPLALAVGVPDTRDTIWSFVRFRVRQNLHIVLSMSPSGDTLRQRVRAFPGLVTATIIDWYFPWSASALERVANKYLQDVVDPGAIAATVSACVFVHSSVVAKSEEFRLKEKRVNVVTSAKYLEFLNTYCRYLTNQRNTLQHRASRLEGGLIKLVEASEAVNVLQSELKEQKVIIDAKTTEVSQMLDEIATRKGEADKQQASAAKKAAELEESAKIIAEESEKANKTLEQALPALEEAAEAIKDLKQEDITNMRTVKQPLPAVLAVCRCLMALEPWEMREPEPYTWAACQQMMSNNFLGQLKNYNLSNLNERKIKKVLNYYPKQEDAERISSINLSAAGLLKWVDSMIKYWEVAKRVEPLKEAVAMMERRQAEGIEELERTKRLLRDLDREIEDLDNRYQVASAELVDLHARATAMARRLTAAEKLLSGLTSEKDRWTIDVRKLKEQFPKTLGNALLSASFLTYAGPFTYPYRKELLHGVWEQKLKELNIPYTDPFSLVQQLTTDTECQKWAAEGLPTDEQSVWNGIVATQSSSWPLFIDPQLQASNWIRTRSQDLRVSSLGAADYISPLRLAIQYGKPFLLEDVDQDLDGLLLPILEKNTYIEGGQKMLVLGDASIPWDDQFRLYLVTRLPNPVYSPETMSLTQVINFGITPLGLEGQLLDIVVSYERPELQQSWFNLVQSMSANAQKLEELEESILRNLVTSSGNILDNDDLVAALDVAKSEAISILSKQEHAKTTKEEISAARSVYQGAAVHGSILYFAVSALPFIHPLYESSLASYLTVFRNTLSSTKRSTIVDLRVRNIVTALTRNIFDYTCTGLFERHKLLFALHLAVCIAQGGKNIDMAEYDFFIRGNPSLDEPTEANPLPHWIQPSGWKDLQLLRTGIPHSRSPDAFQPILQSLLTPGHEARWLPFLQHPLPTRSMLPDSLDSTLTPLQYLCFLRVLRPDAVYSACRDFVQLTMGDYFIQPPLLSFPRIFEQMKSTVPAVFITSPGADPQADVQALGAAMGFPAPSRLRTLALGQGQGHKAEELIAQGAQRGHWVFLANTHLLQSWLPRLEQIINGIVNSAGTKSAPHPDFRLWVTTDARASFPLGVLQNSLKVVIEPRDGLKLNMLSCFSKVHSLSDAVSDTTQHSSEGNTSPEDKETPGFIEESLHPAYRPLVYVLCWFHAVLLERKKYGKLGFNVPYDFNDSDFFVSKRLIALYLNKALEANSLDSELMKITTGEAIEEGTVVFPKNYGSLYTASIPWKSLRYLLGESMYGGRVSDPYDRRILISYCEEFIGDFVLDPLRTFLFASKERGSEVDYPLPPPGTFADYEAFVHQIPVKNSPITLGLHENAEISYSVEATTSLWRNLATLNPRHAAPDTASDTDSAPDASSAPASPSATGSPSILGTLLQLVPPPFGQEQLRRSLPPAIGPFPDPITVVLVQDVARYDALVEYVARDLQDLQKALQGEIMVTADLESSLAALEAGQVPEPWKRRAPATTFPLSAWMQHLQKRYQHYQSWIEYAVAIPSRSPPVVWLAGIHVPEAYISALVQGACRRKHWALDRCTLTTRVTKYQTLEDIPDAEQALAMQGEYAFATGLYLEGARWDTATGALAMSEPKVLISPLPLMQIIPADSQRLLLSNSFKCPVYATRERRNAMGVGLVFEADLTSYMHPSIWILSGVSLSLNGDS